MSFKMIECSECGVMLDATIDDIGDKDRPLCEVCQDGFQMLDDYLAHEDSLDLSCLDVGLQRIESAVGRVIQ